MEVSCDKGEQDQEVVLGGLHFGWVGAGRVQAEGAMQRWAKLLYSSQ